MINIEHANKAEILAALYNNSKIQGMGFLQAKPGLMTTEEAAELLKTETYFDYLYGKCRSKSQSCNAYLDTKRECCNLHK